MFTIIRTTHLKYKINLLRSYFKLHSFLQPTTVPVYIHINYNNGRQKKSERDSNLGLGLRLGIEIGMNESENLSRE